jgi:hypothetical protein
VLNVNFHKSVDGGKTWTTIRVPHGDNHDMWIAPNDSDADDRSQRRRRHRARSTAARRGRGDDADGAVLSRDHDRHVPYHVCGAQQDNSTACVSRRAPQGGPGGSGGGAIRCFYSVAARERLHRQRPRNPDIFYAAATAG